jgi:hypothetical protein
MDFLKNKKKKALTLGMVAVPFFVFSVSSITNHDSNKTIASVNNLAKTTPMAKKDDMSIDYGS